MNEKVFNQETEPTWNREPGIAVVPGSNYQQEMARFEQFPHDKWAFGSPGNPYTYRAFPKMLYRAERYEGNIACMAAEPDAYLFRDPRDYERAQIAARKFTERCQLVVNDEREMQKAMENGWRESPGEAVDALKAREAARSEAAAVRNYEDRNMSEGAKREIREALEGADEHVAEIPEKRRGRPRKVS